MLARAVAVEHDQQEPALTVQHHRLGALRVAAAQPRQLRGRGAGTVQHRDVVARTQLVPREAYLPPGERVSQRAARGCLASAGNWPAEDTGGDRLNRGAVSVAC